MYMYITYIYDGLAFIDMSSDEFFLFSRFIFRVVLHALYYVRLARSDLHALSIVGIKNKSTFLYCH